MTNEPNICDLINAKRASGYDGAFEKLLAQPWYCPHCKASKTILQVMIPLGHPDQEPACVDCDKEGVMPANGGDYRKQFRKVLKALSPYNRSGTA
jgi:glutaredoxin